MTKKTTDRRKAIDCKLIEASKTSPGYFKYAITIQEVDGTIHTVPAYGVDMQDAIKRLLKTEMNDKIRKIYVRKIEPITLLLVALGWIGSVVYSSATGNYVYAYWGVIAMLSIAMAYAIFQGLRKW